jgi:hypothetical protein
MIKIPLARAKAATASLPTLLDEGSVFFKIRRTHATGGSNSTAEGGATVVVVVVVATVVVVGEVLLFVVPVSEAAAAAAAAGVVEVSVVAGVLGVLGAELLLSFVAVGEVIASSPPPSIIVVSSALVASAEGECAVVVLTATIGELIIYLFIFTFIISTCTMGGRERQTSDDILTIMMIKYLR